MKAHSICGAASLLVFLGCSGGPGGEVGQGNGAPGSELGTAAAPAISAGAVKQAITQITPAEYANTVNVLLGISLSPQSAPPSGDPTVGGVLPRVMSSDEMALAYYSQATTIATTVTSATNLSTLLQDANCAVPAQNSGSDGVACATAFINEFAPLAFRQRALDASTLASLTGVYTSVAVTQQAGFSRGLAAVLQEILQSPYFLYRGLPA